MSLNARTRFRRRLMFLLLIGLPIALLVVILMRRKRGWLRIFKNSEYANYIPWLIAQSKHETNNWRSSLFNNHKSLFGFKMSKRVEWDGYQGPQSPEGDYYAGYKNYADSAQHYLNWLRYNGVSPDLDNLEDFIGVIRDKGFFTDTYENYLNGVRRFV